MLGLWPPFFSVFFFKIPWGELYNTKLKTKNKKSWEKIIMQFFKIIIILSSPIQGFYYYINTHIAVVQGLAEGLENQSLISNTHITVVVVRELVSAVTIICSVCADERLCPADQFECYESRSSGADHCIQGNWQCDGENNCPHGEDERYCNSECSWQHSHNTFNRLTSYVPHLSLLAFEHTVSLDIAGFLIGLCVVCVHVHTPSIALWHLPPDSARFGYATEGALFISAQLSTDAVSAL